MIIHIQEANNNKKNLKIIKYVHTCMRLIDTINSPIPNKLIENFTAIDICSRLKKHIRT